MEKKLGLGWHSLASLMVFLPFSCHVSLPNQLGAQELLAPVDANAVNAELSVAREAIGAIANQQNARASEVSTRVFQMVRDERLPERKAALLEEVYQWSIQQNDIDTAIRCLDMLESTFDQSCTLRKIETFAQFLKSPRDSLQKMNLISGMATSCREAIDEGYLNEAEQALKDAKRKVPKENRRETAGLFTSLTKKIEARNERRIKYEAAQHRLIVAPDEAGANLDSGMHLLFDLNDKAKGFESLAKGADQKLADVARIEMSFPSTLQEKRMLAEAWWDISGLQSGDPALWSKRRSAFWYGQIVGSLSQIDATVARSRIEEGNRDNLVPVRTFDLMAPEIGKRLQNGTYDSNGRTVLIRSTEQGICGFDRNMPPFYDFACKFHRTHNKYGIKVEFPGYRRRLGWCFNGQENAFFHLTGFNGSTHPIRFDGSLPEGGDHDLVIRVRPSRFLVELDGKKMFLFDEPFPSTQDAVREALMSGRPSEQIEIIDFWGNLTLKRAVFTEYR